MQNSNAFPPFRPDRTDNLAEELYPDIFAAASPPTVPESAPPTELYSTRPAQPDMTEEVPQIVQTEQLAVPPGTTRDLPDTQSLTAALRTTMPWPPKRETVIIPGAKKRQRNMGRISQTQAEPHFNPLLRILILLIFTLLMLLATLLFPLIIRQ